MYTVLEIGAGMKPTLRKGQEIIHLDRVKLPHIEVVHDIESGKYPFEDNTFDEVLAFSVLEHTMDIIKQLEEIHRICKDGARVSIEVPYYNSPDAFRDPTHKSFFTERTMEYFTDSGEFNFYTKARFEIKAKKYASTFIGKLVPEKLKVKLAHYIGNIITGIQWILIVKK
jgi:SAM-dependent methyltransferase